MRFFFDYTKDETIIHDYQGVEFGSPDHALDFARATAERLSHSLTDEWRGWSIKARDPQGSLLFSVSVHDAPAGAQESDAVPAHLG